MSKKKLQFFDFYGEPLRGGLISTFQPGPGSSVPKLTFTDETLLVPNSNPIQCDSEGFCSIHLVDGEQYKIFIRDPSGSPISTIDYMDSLEDLKIGGHCK